jgi:hypothetical protein
VSSLLALDTSDAALECRRQRTIVDQSWYSLQFALNNSYVIPVFGNKVLKSLVYYWIPDRFENEYPEGYSLINQVLERTRQVLVNTL